MKKSLSIDYLVIADLIINFVEKSMNIIEKVYYCCQ